MNIYIAAPLFNEMEIQRNSLLSKYLEEFGFETYLPQRDGGLYYDYRNQGMQDKEIRDKIFISDYNAIFNCDTILCLLDGRVLDEGMCIELGIAFALGKNCIGYKTDKRSQDRFGNNVMLDGTLSFIASTKVELLKHLRMIEANSFVATF